MKRCPHCMKNSIGPVCPYCGKSTAVEAHSSLLPVGTVLNGRYEVGAVLGQGGFGITYAAWDKQTQQRVAIKEYFPNRCTSKSRNNRVNVVALNGYEQVYAKGMQTFAHEGQTLAQVTHIPEVVHVLDGFHANNTSYIVMEFVEGKGLDKVIEEKGKMTTAEMTRLFAPLIKVIEQLHQMDITHRDISPDNVILMPNGTLKLIDFGSARHIENGKSVTIHLKPGFSPAEQYTTRGQGPFTDVYALAATIYYCLTATIPVRATERLEAEVDPLKSPRALGADLTEEQEAVILWGMTVQPQERPRTMEIFARRFCELFPMPESKPEPEPLEPTEETDIKADEQPDNESENIGKALEDQKVTDPYIPPKPYNKEVNKVKKEHKEKIKKKPNKIMLTILLSVAAVVVIVLGVLLYNLPTILQNMNPVFQITTEDGMTVEIDRNAGTAVLLDAGVKPAYAKATVSLESSVTVERYGRVDGTYNITKIAEGAYNNVANMQRLVLPSTVKTVEDGAFNNCDALMILSLSSPVTMDGGAFVNCDKPLIWENVQGGDLDVSDDFKSYVRGTETARGPLVDILYDDQGILYGLTGKSQAVILDVPAHLSEFTIKDLSPTCPVTGMAIEALDELDSPTVYVSCDSFVYPIELRYKAVWDYDNSSQGGYNLSGSWHLSLTIADLLAVQYGPLDSSEELFYASHEILKRCMVSDSDNPLQDFDWGELLNQYDVDWNNARALYQCAETEAETDILKDMVDASWEAKDNGEPYTSMALIILDDGSWCECICVLHN